MSRRPIRRRVLAVLAGATLLLGVSSHAYGLRPCPHHEAVAHDGSGTTHVGETEHHGPASDAGARAHDAPASDAGEPGHGPCTCVGECQGSGGALLPDVDAAAVVAAGTLAPVVFPSLEALPLPAPAPYLLPYPNGPPSLV